MSLLESGDLFGRILGNREFERKSPFFGGICVVKVFERSPYREQYLFVQNWVRVCPRRLGVGLLNTGKRSGSGFGRLQWDLVKHQPVDPGYAGRWHRERQ